MELKQHPAILSKSLGTGDLEVEGEGDDPLMARGPVSEQPERQGRKGETVQLVVDSPSQGVKVSI